MYFLRCLTTRATILPSPICTVRSHILAIGGCNSCIFSGHTAATLLLAHALAAAHPEWTGPLLVYCVLASAAILVTRSHYTVDVLVAWIASYAVVHAVS